MVPVPFLIQAESHAALVCGFFNLMNRWVEGLGIESEPQTIAMAGRMLHEKGYGAVTAMLETEGAAKRQ